MPENIRICARCGKEFVADIDDYICSNECAEAIVQEMNKKWGPERQIANSKKICVQCSKGFAPRISAQVCCSKECGNERRKELKRKYRSEKKNNAVKIEIPPARSAKGGRLCHDCKQPVPGNNYRCADCWRKWRIKYHISDDAFHNSSGLLAHCDGF